ncbi:membrane protein YqaA with SNARE-associated domain [Breznakibacter xylanolyticus]|uniref:Membrane protein YqaA with SNARE-associated domain n=1 Tax=Breznakibacter xylanolyticus TaxID=990 RepID=A0A2W7N5G0_9BACT|nr:VTT domain-containing protein [Breznakibacter xylanolyticus]MBN2744433.1 VTT domain-containing protein [Marinilabiliaceae bacterium]PZX13557.1 membrane protein YqaA with SNARE-associated domain [Breznakibacter xylanolyticus]
MLPNQRTKTRAIALNRYYRITRFYEFLTNLSIKGGITIAVVVSLFVLLELFVIDTRALLDSLVENYSEKVILSTFLLSETLMGLLPPEIFIAWSSKMSSPWFYLFLLSSASYIGGFFAFMLGRLVYQIPPVRDSLEIKLAGHIKNLRKWGGLFVFVGAMLPLPHSLVSMACGLIKYDLKYYLLWALFRFLRFYIYALVIFSVI